MGQVKRCLEQKRQSVENILVRSKIFKKCTICGQVIDDSISNDLTPGYKLGNYLISQGDSLVEVFEGNRQELSDFLLRMFKDTSDICFCGLGEIPTFERKS